MHSLRGALALAAIVGGLAAPATAQFQEPGSMLVFPEYDNRNGIVTMLTVTNSNPIDPVNVEFIYYEAFDFTGASLACQQFNKIETLTARDTLTLLTNFHNPAQTQGYVVAFATDRSNTPIAFNHLIGQTMTLDGTQAFEYAVNPVVFLGEGSEGSPTDVNNDGVRDLNGTEYSKGPDQLLFPRFLGQGGQFDSDLVLIDMSGGGGHLSTVDFLIYNDNEEAFSTQYIFECWTRVQLLDVSAVYDNAFLANFTNQNPQELYGAPQVETGWFEVDGSLTVMPSGISFRDPLLLAVLVERIGNRGTAYRPFTTGLQKSEPAQPPTCPSGVSIQLWPPDRSFTTLDLAQVSGVTDPGGLPLVVICTAITQDEHPNPSGATVDACDGKGVGLPVVEIRAERRGNGNGRVYRVHYRAVNSAAERCDGFFEVTVPILQNGAPAVDDGQIYDSTEGC